MYTVIDFSEILGKPANKYSGSYVDIQNYTACGDGLDVPLKECKGIKEVQVNTTVWIQRVWNYDFTETATGWLVKFQSRRSQISTVSGTSP